MAIGGEIQGRRESGTANDKLAVKAREVVVLDSGGRKLHLVAGLEACGVVDGQGLVRGDANITA